MFQHSPDVSREDGLDGGIDGELKAAVRTYLATEDEASAVLLFVAIRGLARRTVHGGSRSERDGFIEACPADILCRRESTGTSRLELFDLDHPFIPWVRTVLTRLWISHLDVLRRAIVNTDLLGGVAAEPDGEADAGDLPALTEDGLFTPAVVARMLASTNTARLVAFLAMSGLHRHFPDWEELVRRYELLKERTLPRPFPTLAVELLDTPRTRTAPLARDMGIGLNNTLTQNWRRACTDLRAAFPELVRTIPRKPSLKHPTGERR